MPSVVSICNLALSNIGKENISDINEASAEARACKQFYTHTRDMLLQAYPWGWAGRTQSLAGVTNDKPNRWAKAYGRPSDCLKVRRITSEQMADYVPYAEGQVVAGGFAYSIEGNRIYCNLDPAFLEYTRKVEDVTKFPPLFQDALSWHLSVRLAMPLTRDPRIRADAFQLATQTLADAATSDANEVRTVSDYPAEANEARHPNYAVNRAVKYD